ncbi:MAG TPA: hypothetical protein VK540_04280 [Polyangiaceae bacterium]|nr:hypothetical protein [Polyangiaceae bacterium]
MVFGWAVAAVGCAPHTYTHVTVLPSLRPVDAARPMVVFSQVQGKACGSDAVLGAIRDMKRLNDIDGYLEVVVDETFTRNQHCAQATAYPFRYGTSTSTPVIRAGDEGRDPVVVPGALVPAPVSSGEVPPVAALFDCSQACQRFAPLVETGTVKTALARDRCEQRCKQADVAFQKCIERAHETVTAKACLTP